MSTPLEELPASPDLEQACLGAMLFDAAAIADATEVLTAEDFALDSHQRIFRCIVRMKADGLHVDELTVAHELRRRYELDAIGGPGYLSQLSGGIPKGFNIRAYAGIVKQKSLLRQLYGLHYDGQQHAADPNEDASGTKMRSN